MDKRLFPINLASSNWLRKQLSTLISFSLCCSFASAVDQLIDFTTFPVSVPLYDGYGQIYDARSGIICEFEVDYFESGMTYYFNDIDNQGISIDPITVAGNPGDSIYVPCGGMPAYSSVYGYFEEYNAFTIVPVDDSSLSDSDGDTVADAADNCPYMANKNQADLDGDGIGMDCDARSVTNPFHAFSQIYPLVAGERIAEDVQPAGDINGDGITDLLFSDKTLKKVWVVSGTDQSTVLLNFLRATDKTFPLALTALGDVNGDGFDDIVFSGITASDQNFTQVRSGLDSSLLHSILGPEHRYLKPAGDVNADGFADFIAGKFSDSLDVYSGADKSKLFFLGNGVSAGDVNNDGKDDFLISVPSTTTFKVISGDQTVLHSQSLALAYRDGGVDVNNDNHADYLLQYSNKITLYSGIDFSVMYQYSTELGNNDFASAPEFTGDMNNDGFADFMYAVKRYSYGPDPYRYVIRSGSDGSILFEIDVRQGSYISEQQIGFDYYEPNDIQYIVNSKVKAFADVNADGYADLIHLSGNKTAGISQAEFISLAPAYTDTDGDGYAGNSDTQPANSAIAGDHDGDKVDSVDDNCPFVFNYAQSDSDSDGLGNACDADVDGDGVNDVDDSHPLNPLYYSDFDRDLLNADSDNCPAVSNYMQSDSDNDGIGNACDSDLDGDGYANGSDSHPLNPLYYTDPDRDLINADSDNCPTVSNYVQSDSDGDGIGNACDPDVDGDGVDDVLDNYPLNPNLW